MSYTPHLTAEQLLDERLTATRLSALSINCPGWFARPDFQAWLNANYQTPGASQRASWHPNGELPNEGSDTFMTYDQGDGSDCDNLMPDDIWSAIGQLCAEQGFSQGIIRLTNLDA